MKPSVTAAIGAAWRWTCIVLFSPFDIGKWFTLGFCCFVAQLGQGGGGGSYFNFPSLSQRRAMKPSAEFNAQAILDQIHSFVITHLIVILVIAAMVILLSVALAILLAWLSSRGIFMFLDGVVRNRSAIADPWRRYRAQGNSLMLFRLCLGFGSFVLIAGMIVLCIAIAMPDLRAFNFGMHAQRALWIGVPALLVITILLGIVSLLLYDFVVPVMYKRQTTVIDAFSIVFSEMLPGNIGPVVLYFLMGIVLGMGSAVAVVVVFLVTCGILYCVACIPFAGAYLLTVVLLPVQVFFRSYSIFFLSQFGPQWQLVGADETAVAAPNGDTAGIIDPATPFRL